ncbi:hypothetical protein BMF94_1401 [Rhodotorula taiwanensis]|uniref:Glycosyltransferase family 92 protein n=1 Tax=Rhodotorula taiwanensis TaxID=741276 RepID=A0A2S5BFF0_9BASI|nr:hypothetical protein BMF94_1401 [Rhodotorula taiwanensis]
MHASGLSRTCYRRTAMNRTRGVCFGAASLIALLVWSFVATRELRLSTWRRGAFRSSSSELDAALQQLVHVPAGEVGQLAICASVRSEGRFITEWLLYHRAVGVDRFYLYDSGSLDDTLVMLQPWIDAGTVVLHTFRHDQGGHYQTSALETCSRTYGPTTEWLLEADIDEFHVPTPALKGSAAAPASILGSTPKHPLRDLLLRTNNYADADAVVVSRVTFKNAGIKRLSDGASILRSQTLREFQHSISYDKLLFTKSIVHTRKESTGWVMPGAHFLKHDVRSVNRSKIITPDGHRVELQVNDPDALPDVQGTAYMGQYRGARVFEPLVLYHYVERDLDVGFIGSARANRSIDQPARMQDCLRKLKVAQKLRKGGWRDQAGEEGCKDYDVYQDNDEWVPLHEQNSFYGGAVRDLVMSTSWYGQHLPALVQAGQALARRMAARGPLRQAIKVDPHPGLVDFWRSQGLSTINGMPLSR